MKREQQLSAPATGGQTGVRPGQILLLGVMGLAAMAVFVTRHTGTINMVSVAVAVMAAGLVAAAVYRSLMPLASSDTLEQTDMLAGRTRAGLEREKMLVLRSIKEVEFDHAMRKISNADYQEMLTRLRARAAGLIRQLDGGLGYRDLIERDLAKLVGGSVAGTAAPSAAAPSSPPPPVVEPGTCQGCGVRNDGDARFCKSCGARLGVQS